MRSISVGRLDSLIWLGFFFFFYRMGASARTLTRSLELPVVWNYMDFISALPSGSYYLSNWWTRRTRFQAAEGEDNTLHSSCFDSSYRACSMFSECYRSGFKRDDVAVKNTAVRLSNCGTVKAAAAEYVNNAQSCCWLLIVIQRNSCVTAKSVICFMDKTKWNRRESQAARWCMTHRSFWPCSHRLWQFNISEKSALSKKLPSSVSSCYSIYLKRLEWWDKFINCEESNLIQLSFWPVSLAVKSDFFFTFCFLTEVLVRHILKC